MNTENKQEWNDGLNEKKMKERKKEKKMNLFPSNIKSVCYSGGMCVCVCV